MRGEEEAATRPGLMLGLALVLALALNGCGGGGKDEAASDASGVLCTEEANLSFSPSDKVGSKDFSLLFDGSRFHIFHIRENGAWMGRSVERRFGHEDSPDLVHWTRHEPVDLRGKEGAWNDRHLWSPFVLRRNDKWWMYYTGVSYTNDARLNLQRIGLAFSDDLEHWMAPSSTVDGWRGAAACCRVTLPGRVGGSALRGPETAAIPSWCARTRAGSCSYPCACATENRSSRGLDPRKVCTGRWEGRSR